MTPGNRAYRALVLCNLLAERRRATRWGFHAGCALIGLPIGAWLSVRLGWAERITPVSFALQAAAALVAIYNLARMWWLNRRIAWLMEGRDR